MRKTDIINYVLYVKNTYSDECVAFTKRRLKVHCKIITHLIVKRFEYECEHG